MTASTPSLLKGYYKDSEVIGLPYQCGDQSGVTGADGEFYFYPGEVCGFYMDPAFEHPIRTVDPSALFNSVVIYETDPYVAHTLQLLDSDGDPENGLNIDSTIVQSVLEDPAFEGVPTNRAESDAFAAVIDNNNGPIDVVTFEEAQTHLVSTLLSRGSFYQHCSGRTPETTIMKIDFNLGGELQLNDVTQPSMSTAVNNGNLEIFNGFGTQQTLTLDLDSDSLVASNEPITLNEDVNFQLKQSTLYPSITAAQAAPAEICAFGDTTAPVLTLNGPAILSTGYQTTFDDPGVLASDNLGEDVVVTTVGTVDTAVLGSYTITYIGADSTGNIATSVVRTVNVTDLTAPTIVLNGTSSVIIAQGSSYTDAGASASDSADGTVSVTTTGTVDTSLIGSYVLTYSAVDSAGNAASTVTRTVEVTDQTAPVISILGGAAITIAHGSVYLDQGATASDNVDTSIAVSSSGVVDTNSVGSYSITYAAVDAAGNNAAAVIRTVTVVDQAAPQITLNGPSTVTVAHNGTYTEQGASATDVVDGSLSVSATDTVNTNEVGSYVITYNVSDAAGNAAQPVTRTVNVTDQAPPVITLIGSDTVTIAYGAPSYTDPGATATDSVDGDVSVSSVGAVLVDIVGSYSITYDAVDSAGNAAATVIRTIDVTDQTAPDISIIGESEVTVAHDSTYVDDGATATDNVDGFMVVDITGSVNTSVIGTYTITYNVTDGGGNAATPVTRTVNVTDQTAPSITLNGLASIIVPHNGTYSEQGAMASDAIDGPLTVATSGSVDTSVVGTYTITYDVSDAAGNAATSVTRTVNVTDQAAPIITLIGDETETVLVDSTYVDPGASAVDAVDGSIDVNSDAATVVDTSAIGTYVVSYTVSDSDGNAAQTVTRTVNVVSGIAFTLPLDLYEYDAFSNGANGGFEYETQTLFFNTDDTFIANDMEFISDAFYNEFDDLETEYILENGVWAQRLSPSSGWSLELSELDTVATVNGQYALSITNVQDVGGQSLTLAGISSPVIMPAGSTLTTMAGVQSAEIFILHQRRESNGGTANQYYQNLTEVIQSQCGNRWIAGVDSPNFNFVSFTCGEENQSSGTLTGTKFDGTFVPNIGTWTRGNIPGTSIEAVITYVDSGQLNQGASALTEHKMFAMFGNEVWEGEKQDPGGTFEISAFNQVAFGVIESAVLAETVVAGTNEFQVVDGKLSLKSIADAVFNQSTNQNRSTSSNRYGFNNSNPEVGEAVIDSFEGDINLVEAQTTVNNPAWYSTRSRIGFTHEMYSQSTSYRSRVEVFLEHGTDGNDATIFKAWHTIFDQNGNQVGQEVGLPGIHFATANLNTDYTVKMETVAGGWKYTAGPYTAILLASSFDMNNDGSNEVFGDFLTRKARFDNYVKFPTAFNDSAEGTIDNIVFKVRSADGSTVTVAQDFDRYPDGTRPVFDDELFNDLDISSSTGVAVTSVFDGSYKVLARPVENTGCSGATGNVTITNGVVSGEVLSTDFNSGPDFTKTWILSGTVLSNGVVNAGIGTSGLDEAAVYSGQFNATGYADGSWNDILSCVGEWVMSPATIEDSIPPMSSLISNAWYAVNTQRECTGKFEFLNNGTGIATSSAFGVKPFTYTPDLTNLSLVFDDINIGELSGDYFASSGDTFSTSTTVLGDESAWVWFTDYQEALGYGNSSCSINMPF